MVWKTAFNPGDSPVVCSEDGCTVGGHEWASVETTDPRAAAAVDSGALVLVDASSSDAGLDAEAKRVLEATEELAAPKKAAAAKKEA